MKVKLTQYAYEQMKKVNDIKFMEILEIKHL